MSWGVYILAGFLGAAVFFVAAAYALYWAHKNGQLAEFEKGARTVFDDEEPAGETPDHFPSKRRKKKNK